MRRGWGGGKPFWVMALCAASACGGALRPPPEHRLLVATCTLTDASAAPDTATIAFRTADTTRAACAQRLVAEHLRPWARASSDPWTVHITLTSTGATARRLGGDAARDTIDAGHALVATEDVDLVAYAAARADLEVAPLPWDRTYLRLSRVGSALGSGAGPDAVRVDARPAEGWACNSAIPAFSSDTVPNRSSRIVYDAGDRTARDLAARIVALSERREVTAVGVSAAELDTLLRAGDDLAYIISVPRASQCDALATMAERAQWIGAHTVLPLIETRAYGIAPRAPRP